MDACAKGRSKYCFWTSKYPSDICRRNLHALLSVFWPFLLWEWWFFRCKNMSFFFCWNKKVSQGARSHEIMQKRIVKHNGAKDRKDPRRKMVPKIIWIWGNFVNRIKTPLEGKSHVLYFSCLHKLFPLILRLGCLWSKELLPTTRISDFASVSENYVNVCKQISSLYSSDYRCRLWWI